MGSPKRRGEGRRTEHGLSRSPEESGQKGPETEEEKPEATVSWRPREQGPAEGGWSLLFFAIESQRGMS